MTQSPLPSALLSRPRAWVRRVEKWLFRRATIACPRCGQDLRRAPLYRAWRVCDHCGHHFPLDARRRIQTLADPHSFVELEKYVFTAPRGLEYAQRLRQAKRATHLREAVIIGTATLQQHPVMLVILDFNFLGGTMGAAAGEKIARAFEHAAQRKIPLLAVISSGGARIQEGMVALLQMAKTVAAAMRFHQSGCPFIAVLAHPTTGGVYASFANLADVILAEPGALIGFAGPRVVEILTRQKLPDDSHRAEFLWEHGMVDGIVRRPDLRETLAKLLGLIRPHAPLAPYDAPSSQKHTRPVGQGDDGASPAPITPRRPFTPSSTPWESVQIARRPDRPTTKDYIQRIFGDFIELHGDRVYGDDPAIVAGIAQLEGQGVIIIGQERGRGAERVKRREGRAEPEGYRKAQRLMHLASKWNLPLITFVDTPGADPSYEAEKRGIAVSLAHSIATMLQVRVPTVAVIIGEGGSGGALALAAADRVLMLEHAVYSVITPEGASAILYGDDAHAPELAEALHLTAPELYARGIVDEIIPEPPEGAHTDADAAAAKVKVFLLKALNELSELSSEQLLERRYQKYRGIGR